MLFGNFFFYHQNFGIVGLIYPLSRTLLQFQQHKRFQSRQINNTEVFQEVVPQGEFQKGLASRQGLKDLRCHVRMCPISDSQSASTLNKVFVSSLSRVIKDKMLPQMITFNMSVHD